MRNFPKPEAASYAHPLLSQAKAEAFTTQLTNESKANLVSFVSHFQTLIKIICSDCLGKLFFALPFPSLYQYNFTGSRFPCRGSWQPRREMGEGRRTYTYICWEHSQTSWQPAGWESQTLHCPLDWVPEKPWVPSTEGICFPRKALNRE